MILRALKVEFLILLTLVAVGGLVGWVATSLTGEKAPVSYQLVDFELEPFRSAFNGATDHVRVVLLVGPT